MCYFYSNENGYAATIFSPDLNKTKSLFVETFLLIYTEIVPFAKELIRELWNTVSNSLLLSIINLNVNYKIGTVYEDSVDFLLLCARHA